VCSQANGEAQWRRGQAQQLLPLALDLADVDALADQRF
jgi:hypothetical protein